MHRPERGGLPQILIVLGVVATLTGCATAGGIVGVFTPFDRKIVAAKGEDLTLIARDGSSCMVSRDTWQTVRRDEEVRCWWSEPTLGTTPRASSQ